MMIAAPVSCCAFFSTSSTWAWMVTSRAVVGSSAMITSGSLAIAIAIIARWRMPPENSNGNDLTRCSGFGMPTRSSSSTARCQAAAFDSARCGSGSPRRSGRRSCRRASAPTAGPGRPSTGPGHGCGTSPRRSGPSSSSPCSLMDPSTRAPLASRPMMASEVTDLPEPDSPTMAMVSPARRSKLSPRTARTGPASLGNVTCRSRTSRTTSPAAVRRLRAGAAVVAGLVEAVLMRGLPSRTWGRGRRAGRRRPR